MGSVVPRRLYGEVSMDCEARDDSSIASSRPCSPSPQPEYQNYTSSDAAGAHNIARIGGGSGTVDKNARTRDNLLMKEEEEEFDSVPGLSLAIEEKTTAKSFQTSTSALASISRTPPLDSVPHIVQTEHVETECSSDSMGLDSFLETDIPSANTYEALSLCKQEYALDHTHDNGDTRPLSDSIPLPDIDSARLRPSLHMSAHDFTEAKTIILDLLGWGVPSEYLIHCGLAREAIYYAFTELNLRLPTDFDTDGIIPYEPPSHCSPLR